MAEVYVQRKEQIESISWPSEEPKGDKQSEKKSQKQRSEGDEELDMLRQLGYME